ncbi:hypothetical protein R5R35_000016 [Gryllus longicercus]|uniref:C3H1-type domain-containing protein n=1 Tax=Gryllus longicercus TaxID=2509291 RepID=A0AAN9YXP2_9ORTH
MASLVADYSSTSGSESEAESESDSATDESRKTLIEKLPPPEFGKSSVATVKNSVFSNPFVEAENAKKAILEKHVKMTPTRDEIKMINGKKICWNFRKGRCRFGHNCKFAHDSDLQSSLNRHHANEIANSDLVALPNQVIPIVDEEVEGDSENASITQRKKRPGLSQTLVPGKKVMNMYKKQKVKDSAGGLASKASSR